MTPSGPKFLSLTPLTKRTPSFIGVQLVTAMVGADLVSKNLFLQMIGGNKCWSLLSSRVFAKWRWFMLMATSWTRVKMALFPSGFNQVHLSRKIVLHCGKNAESIKDCIREYCDVFLSLYRSEELPGS